MYWCWDSSAETRGTEEKLAMSVQRVTDIDNATASTLLLLGSAVFYLHGTFMFYHYCANMRRQPTIMQPANPQLAMNHAPGTAGTGESGMPAPKAKAKGKAKPKGAPKTGAMPKVKTAAQEAKQAPCQDMVGLTAQNR